MGKAGKAGKLWRAGAVEGVGAVRCRGTGPPPSILPPPLPSPPVRAVCPGEWRCPGCRASEGLVWSGRFASSSIPGREGRCGRGSTAGAARLGLHRDLALRGASAQRPMFFSLILFPVPWRGACPEGLCGLRCGALCAVRAGPWPWFAVTEVSVPLTGGSRKTHRVCSSSTRMEEPTGNLPIRGDVILPESCCGRVTITNL